MQSLQKKILQDSILKTPCAGGAYLNDPELAETLVTESPDRFRDLSAWGSVFDVEEDCVPAQRPFGGQRFSRTCYAGDRSGHEMIATLTEQIRNTGIRQMQETSAIDLLMDDRRVAGAVTLDGDGNLGVITADATVLATGGGTRCYDISTNCAAGGTGDGFALGYRAGGATLIDMEMVQFHPTGGAVYPPIHAAASSPRRPRGGRRSFEEQPRGGTVYGTL